MLSTLFNILLNYFFKTVSFCLPPRLLIRGKSCGHDYLAADVVRFPFLYIIRQFFPLVEMS